MSKHTGARPDEVFIGNTTGDISHLASLTTVRLGDVALDIDGLRLPPIYRPVFINRSESDAYDRIMMARFEAASRRKAS